MRSKGEWMFFHLKKMPYLFLSTKTKRENKIVWGDCSNKFENISMILGENVLSLKPCYELKINLYPLAKIDFRNETEDVFISSTNRSLSMHLSLFFPLNRLIGFFYRIFHVRVSSCIERIPKEYLLKTLSVRNFLLSEIFCLHINTKPGAGINP